MNAYFFRMTDDERENILDQHKSLYDGYVVRQQNDSSPKPLYVQDFANDKGGVVVNNKGEVKPYTNVGINEDFKKGVDLGKYNLKKIFIDDEDFEDDKEEEITDLEDNEFVINKDKTKSEEKEQYEKVDQVGFGTETEVNELSPSSLEKGKKYRYITPTTDDKIEFDDELDTPEGKKFYRFKGEKEDTHIIPSKDVESDVSDDYEEMTVDDVIDWFEELLSKDEKSGIEDVEWEDITEGLNEEVKEGLMDLFFPKKTQSKKPYTAEAVQHILKLINNAKTEEHLDSVMNMVRNLYSMNDDVNPAYKQRIDIAYKRKSDELGNYLKKRDIEKIMSSVEPEIESEKFDQVRESIQESLKWFNRFKKFN